MFVNIFYDDYYIIYVREREREREGFIKRRTDKPCVVMF